MFLGAREFPPSLGVNAEKSGNGSKSYPPCGPYASSITSSTTPDIFPPVVIVTPGGSDPCTTS